MNFRTRFSDRVRSALVCADKSLTQQHFRDEADINVIIKRYSEPNHAPVGAISGTRVPLFGDFSHVPDLMEAQKQLKAAEASFMGLPSELRRRFNNNPLELLAFVQNSQNRVEAEKLGLIDKATPPDQPIGTDVSGVSAVNSETVANQ